MFEVQKDIYFVLTVLSKLHGTEPNLLNNIQYRTAIPNLIRISQKI